MNSFYTSVHEWGGKILYRGYENGRRIKQRINFEPYFFVPSNKTTNTYKDVWGKPLSRIDFPSIKDARNKIETLEGFENSKIYGLTNWPYLFIYDLYQGENATYDETSIKIGYLDIEVESDGKFPEPSIASEQIISIALEINEKVFVWGLKDYVSEETSIHFEKCDDESDLLRKFLRTWKKADLDIVSGFNVDEFDMTYLYNRIKSVLGKEKADELSPWGIVREKTTNYGSQHFEFYGLFIADYLPIYKKFSFKNLESFQLKIVALEELGDTKLDFAEHKSFKDLYEKNYQRFIDYNIQDCQLVSRLEKKLRFINLILARAYLSKINYGDTLGTVRPWDCLIHDYLMKQGIVIPPQVTHTLDEELIGAYVKDVNPSFHEWVAGLDVKSEYPHVIRQWNISPETLVTGVRHSNPKKSIQEFLEGKIPSDREKFSIAANGSLYRKEHEGFLPALMRSLYDSRTEKQKKLKEVRKELSGFKEHDPRHEELKRQEGVYNSLQRAFKDTLNAGYGALANPYNRWFSLEMAESVTSTGQLVIRTAEKTTNDLMNRTAKTENVNYVIAADTDSVYVEMGPLVSNLDVSPREKLEIVGKFSRNCIKPTIEKSHIELAQRMGCKENLIQMNVETISNRAIWRASKIYILNLVEDDGLMLDEPKLKLKGIEAIRSSTPRIVRDAIKKALKIIMNGEEKELIDFVKQFQETFENSPFEDVAFPRSISGLTKYYDPSTVYKKGTPIQVKGALLYNYLLERKSLTGDYPLIHNSDKIKFCYLREPNPVICNVISCTHDLPSEFGLNNYLDLKKQFEKSFLAPLDQVLDVMKWDIRSSLLNKGKGLDLEGALF